MNDQVFLLAAAGFLVWMLLSNRKDDDARRKMAAGNAPAGGIPPRTGLSTEAAIGGAIGAGACVAGGAALGAPQAGAALAPLCSALGSQLAPYVKDGAIWLGGKAADGGVALYNGAAWTVEKTGEGAEAVGRAAYNYLENPIDSSTHLAAGGAKVADRLLDQAWENSPTLVKAAAAPVYLATKTATTAIKYGAAAVDAAGNLLDKIPNPFGGGGVNCSVAQQPANARWCREKYGQASAPGSEAWAAANGQQVYPPVTGPASEARRGAGHF